MSSTDVCTVRRHQLERLEVGELSGEDAVSLRAHAASCDTCTGRLAALAAARQAFAASVDPAIDSARLLDRLEGPSVKRSWRAWVMPVALAASMAGVILANGPLADSVRSKGGGVQLTLFVDRAGGPAEAGPGEALRAGDRIQFRYAAAGHRYIYVVSVDGRRAISSLYPASPGSSVEVEPSGERVLPGSIILDDAVGPERVFAFFSDTPLSFDEVEGTLTGAVGDQDLRGVDRVEWAGPDQASVWFLKVP